LSQTPFIFIQILILVYKETMKKQIKAALAELEYSHKIKILYAVESGSRAWGFASTDSDWDVRFIYVHRPEWYFSIEKRKDCIEQMLPDKLDLSGWEITKAMNLFRKSNPPLLEWLRSPYIYMEQGAFAGKLRDMSDAYFSPKSCIYHYLHMAERNYRAYFKDSTVPIKKYFYMLRPLLACRWILAHATMAPMEFLTLLEDVRLESAVRTEIDKLLARKLRGEEMKRELSIAILNSHIENEIKFFNEYVSGVPNAAWHDSDALNKLCADTVKEVWGASF